MKKTLLSLSILVLLSTPFMSFAKDDIYNMEVKNAMDTMPDNVKQEIGSFKFYFGNDSSPSSSTKVGKVYANGRTNGFWKGYEKSCNRVFYSDLIHLKKSALKIDPKATGAANITSNWKNNLTSSEDSFVCGKGLLMAGVALRGDVVK